MEEITKKKHSGLGMASFCISIVVAIFIFFFRFTFYLDNTDIVVTILYSLFMCLAALVLGIGGLLQKDREKLLSILGIILSITLICLGLSLAIYILKIREFSILGILFFITLIGISGYIVIHKLKKISVHLKTEHGIN